jgi:hypothetical protein
MKNTKQLNVTKTPIDIKRRLDLAIRHLTETVALLGSLDQTSFPPGYLHEAASLSDLALASVLTLDTVRPRKKTERSPVVEAPVTGDTPDLAGPSEGFDTSFDFGANLVDAEVAVEAAPEPTPSVDELRRMRKRERDRESAARRRAAKAA